MVRDEPQRVDIMGINVDRVNMAQAVEKVVNWLEVGRGSVGKHYVVTVNPEFIIAAQKDKEFRRILNAADLAVADGVGLRLSGKVTDIVGGIYLLEELCRVASERGFTAAFLGGHKNVAKQAADCLQKKYPGLKVVFAEDGPEINSMGYEVYSIEEGQKRKPRHTTYSIPNTDLLFVGFGQIKQEKWIARNLEKLPIKVAMGVGGSFDEIAGRQIRVPKWGQQAGLKWLIRLIQQPSRFKRQLAIWQFAWKAIRG